MEKRENVKDSEFTQTSVPASQKKSFWKPSASSIPIVRNIQMPWQETAR